MNLPASTLQQVQDLLARNRKLDAVKLVYETARCSLKEAKDYVDTLGTSAMPAAPVTSGNIDDQIRDLLGRREKMLAIKLYKEHTGKDLAVSKAYVDHLEQHGTPPPPSSGMSTQIDQIMLQQAGSQRSGNGSGRIVLALIIVAAAVLAWVLLRR